MVRHTEHLTPLKVAALAISLLSYNCWPSQVLAFAPPRTITNSRYTNVPPLSALDKDIHNDQSLQGDADDVIRRRLVFSLLASSSLIPASALAALDGYSVSSVTTSSQTISSIESETIRVLRPPLDKRQYETYSLPNRLKVLLCSDPTSTAAAVGMNVHVGACSDPVDIPGLVRLSSTLFISFH